MVGPFLSISPSLNMVLLAFISTIIMVKKFNSHIMGLYLTYDVNLKLSTRQTTHALKEVHGIDISHTIVDKFKDFPGKALKLVLINIVPIP